MFPMIGAPLVPEMKIYIESGLKSDQFLMYGMQKISGFHAMCVCYLFLANFQNLCVGDVKHNFFLGWPKYQFKFRYLVKYQFKLRHLVKYQFKLRHLVKYQFKLRY